MADMNTGKQEDNTQDLGRGIPAYLCRYSGAHGSLFLSRLVTKQLHSDDLESIDICCNKCASGVVAPLNSTSPGIRSRATHAYEFSELLSWDNTLMSFEARKICQEYALGPQENPTSLDRRLEEKGKLRS